MPLFQGSPPIVQTVGYDLAMSNALLGHYADVAAWLSKLDRFSAISAAVQLFLDERFGPDLYRFLQGYALAFSGKWARLQSKYDGKCSICEQPYAIGAAIFWKKVDNVSVVAHERCFSEATAGVKGLPDTVLTEVTGALLSEVERLRKENEMLREALKDALGVG